MESTSNYNEASSIWDTLCTGDNKSLWLSDEQALIIDTSEDEILLKDTFTDGKGTEITAILFKDHLMVVDAQFENDVKMMELGLVKCLWRVADGKKYFTFIKAGEEYILITDSYKLWGNWKEKLRMRLLITDFHDEY